MKLYHMGLAVNPRRARMFLAEKGVAVDLIELNIPEGQNLTPEFLAINPRGLLPTLVLDDGTVIDESIAICRYIEGIQPEPNLMGRTPLEMAQIESWQRRMEFDGLQAIGMAFRNKVPFFATRQLPGSAPSMSQMPELVDRGTVLARHWLQGLDARLAQSPYVAGEQFTIADITALCAVDFAKAIKVFITDDLVSARRRYDGVSARPSAKA